MRREYEDMVTIRNNLHKEEIDNLTKNLCPICPVCLEKMEAVKIFCCENGCIICVKCKERLLNNKFLICSTCRSKRGYFVRNISLETMVKKMFQE